jgi:hypothetical protein
MLEAVVQWFKILNRAKINLAMRTNTMIVVHPNVSFNDMINNVQNMLELLFLSCKNQTNGATLNLLGVTLKQRI